MNWLTVLYVSVALVCPALALETGSCYDGYGSTKAALKWIPEACRSRLIGTYEDSDLHVACAEYKRQLSIRADPPRTPDTKHWSFTVECFGHERGELDQNTCEMSLKILNADCGKKGGITEIDN